MSANASDGSAASCAGAVFGALGKRGGGGGGGGGRGIIRLGALVAGSEDGGAGWEDFLGAVMVDRLPGFELGFEIRFEGEGLEAMICVGEEL